MKALGSPARLWKPIVLVVVGAVGGGGAWALASVPGGDGVIHACLNQVRSGTATVPDTSGPNIVIIDPSAGQHCIPPDDPVPNQKEISWNVTGPQGIGGPVGATGATGPGGQGGSPGSAGPVGAGATTTLQLPRPVFKSTAAALGTVSLGSVTFPILAYTQVAPPAASARSAKVTINDFAFVKKVDKSSAKLFLASAQGKRFPVATLKVGKKGKKGKDQQEFLVIKLDDVLISSIHSQTTGTGPASQPLETLTLDFTRSRAGP